MSMPKASNILDRLDEHRFGKPMSRSERRKKLRKEKDRFRDGKHRTLRLTRKPRKSRKPRKLTATEGPRLITYKEAIQEYALGLEALQPLVRSKELTSHIDGFDRDELEALIGTDEQPGTLIMLETYLNIPEGAYTDHTSPSEIELLEW